MKEEQATATTKTKCGVPFDFAQGRLLHCATHDETVSRFGLDDDSFAWGWKKQRQRQRLEQVIQKRLGAGWVGVRGGLGDVEEREEDAAEGGFTASGVVPLL